MLAHIFLRYAFNSNNVMKYYAQLFINLQMKLGSHYGKQEVWSLMSGQRKSFHTPCSNFCSGVETPVLSCSGGKTREASSHQLQGLSQTDQRSSYRDQENKEGQACKSNVCDHICFSRIGLCSYMSLTYEHRKSIVSGACLADSRPLCMRC